MEFLGIELCKSKQEVNCFKYCNNLEEIDNGGAVGGNEALPHDCKESISRTHAQESVGWQDTFFMWKYCDPLGFQCPISVFPRKKSNYFLIKTKTEASVRDSAPY